jgi:hypothetical protein
MEPDAGYKVSTDIGGRIANAVYMNNADGTVNLNSAKLSAMGQAAGPGWSAVTLDPVICEPNATISL